MKITDIEITDKDIIKLLQAQLEYFRSSLKYHANDTASPLEIRAFAQLILRNQIPDALIWGSPVMSEETKKILEGVTKA